MKIEEENRSYFVYLILDNGQKESLFFSVTLRTQRIWLIKPRDVRPQTDGYTEGGGKFSTL